MLRRTFIAGSLGTMASVLTACKQGTIERSGDLYTGAALAFGTVVKVSLFHADGRVAERAVDGHPLEPDGLLGEAHGQLPSLLPGEADGRPD